MAQANVYQPIHSNHVEVTSSVIQIHIKMKVKKIVWTLITLGIVVVLLAVGTYLFNLFTAFDAEKAYFSGQVQNNTLILILKNLIQFLDFLKNMPKIM